MDKLDVLWKDEINDSNYPAAQSYLSLILSFGDAAHVVSRLKNEPYVYFAAKDIIRASGKLLLPKDNYHVKKNLEKIFGKKRISPVLLHRFSGRLEIADGYHRCCAIYHHNEDALIKCKIY